MCHTNNAILHTIRNHILQIPTRFSVLTLCETSYYSFHSYSILESLFMPLSWSLKIGCPSYGCLCAHSSWNVFYSTVSAYPMILNSSGNCKHTLTNSIDKQCKYSIICD